MDDTQFKHRVLVTQPVSEAALNRLALFFDVEVRLQDRRLEFDELLASLADKAGVMTNTLNTFDAPLVRKLPKLKAVCNMESDYRNMDLQALTAAGIRATNTPEAASESLANSAWEALLDVLRKAAVSASAESAGVGSYSTKWRRNISFGVNPQIFTVGFHGDGPLLQSLARRAQAAAIPVIASAAQSLSGVPTFASDEFWSRADFVIIAAPESADCMSIRPEQIALMKPDARLISFGPAVVADLPSLFADRLIQCRLAAAATSEQIDHSRQAAENLIASLGFGRHSWHPADLLNPDVICESCC